MKYSKDKQEMTYVNNRTKITNMRFFRLYILSELIQYSNCHKVIRGGASLYNESDDDYSVVKSIVSVDDNDDDTTVGVEPLYDLNQDLEFGNDEVKSLVTTASDEKYCNNDSEIQHNTSISSSNNSISTNLVEEDRSEDTILEANIKETILNEETSFIDDETKSIQTSNKLKISIPKETIADAFKLQKRKIDQIEATSPFEISPVRKKRKIASKPVILASTVNQSTTTINEFTTFSEPTSPINTSATKIRRRIEPSPV
jgi:hypothetical protein